jgi:hypothetical protein
MGKIPAVPAHQVEYEHNLALVRAHLDETALATAWSTGAAMSLEQAIAYALDPTADASTVRVQAARTAEIDV